SESKWEVLLDSFDADTLRRSRKVKRLVQGGVAPTVRARFYYVLSGAPKIELAGEYARLVGQEALPVYDEIERDVARCYPDHALFAEADSQGQRQLRRILRAYAQYNRDIGYCQGMGRLVGLFLITGLSEEQAFWVLAATIANFIPRFYERDMGGLREHTSVFEVLLHERNPRLARHLAEQGCDVLMYATPWFITVFTLSLPWPAALRVWDWFLYRGTKVLFRASLGIIDLASPYLLEACPTIAELMGFLLHIPPALVDADTVVAAAMRVKVSERHIDRLIQRAALANKSTS
ncbi:TBC-domain-containing protein, partial [Coemansia reversa NRRL 1564]